MNTKNQASAEAHDDLIAAAKRVSWKFGHDDAGTPSDWSEWVDLRAAIAAAEKAQAQPKGTEPARCQYCDGTGDVHGLDGEWRGECNQCPAAALRLADAIDPLTRKAAPDHLTSKVAADALRRLAAVQAPAVGAEPVLWRYRRWTPDIDGEGYLLSPWYETRTDPRATLANQNTAPLAEVVQLYASNPVLKADAPASVKGEAQSPVGATTHQPKMLACLGVMMPHYFGLEPGQRVRVMTGEVGVIHAVRRDRIKQYHVLIRPDFGGMYGAWEVTPIGESDVPVQPTAAPEPIRCPERVKNGGTCPHHNLHCGWPACNKEAT